MSTNVSSTNERVGLSWRRAVTGGLLALALMTLTGCPSVGGSPPAQPGGVDKGVPPSPWGPPAKPEPEPEADDDEGSDG